jgi:hypothetical protein
VSFKRKLLAGTAVFLLAGGGTGAAIAASGQSRSLPPAPRQLRVASVGKASFVKATAQYLDTNAATLRQEAKGGRTLAEIADATPGRSAKQLSALLLSAASVKLQLIADRALTPTEQESLRAQLRRQIVGFLTDTCPLALGSIAKHLRGCAGMGMPRSAL